ncbi:hypothetical protein NLI96_g12983 [Meripilus lineatus]|uniref:Cobalamin-independent methionine synthase MetE C-terminal/archaeal domain-containing protein n=1 Tax=Meripilus lineatus TaxID=2056292 RepID=A0AAD5Y9D1_9APHY|nr:hypothetical protein NLI96_g12983 [Physisporinus lineatus]
MSTTASQRTSAPLRAQHVGSLLRPAPVLEKREEATQGKCTPEELKAVQDAAIASVVQLQREVGIRSITDGEMRRNFFYEGMFEGLDGMTFEPNRPLEDFKGKIRRTKGIHTEDFKYLKSLVSPEEVKDLKVTVCAPVWLHVRHGSETTYDHSVYANDDEYFTDLLQAYREEFNELYDLGCRNIQIDDPSFCFFCAETMISAMEKAGIDHEAMLDFYIGKYNDLLRGRPKDLTVGVHMCRGNFRGMHYCEGGYERIAVKLFNELDVNCYLLEYDDERAGGLEPLRYLPAGKTVVLGMVSSKTGLLESVDALKARVEEAVKVICDGNPERTKEGALNQLCISPQCGFASVAEGNPISEEDERQKLTLVVETAKAIWGTGM